jgi:hypothetical protein
VGLTRFLVRNDERASFRGFAILYALALVISYATLVLPQRTYVRIWLNDTLGLLDVAYRVHVGQIPYFDFKFLYGPAVAYIPSFAFDLGLNAASVFAFGAIVVAALLLLAAAAMLPCRMAPFPAFLCFGYVWLMIVVPMEESGASFANISWGTFYNRHGWAAIILILTFYLPPLRETARRQWIDAIALAGLTLFAAYTKFTFGCVALAFIFANMIVSPYNRAMSIKALGVTLAGAVAFELVFHFHAAYLANIRTVLATMPTGTFDKWALIKMGFTNAPIIVASLASWLVAYATGRRNWLDSAFVLSSIGASMAVRTTIGANPVLGLNALFVPMLVMGELARRAVTDNGTAKGDEALADWHRFAPAVACIILAVTFTSREVLDRLVAWEDHFIKSVSHAYQPLPGTPKRLAGFIVPPKGDDSLLDAHDPRDPTGELLTRYRMLLDSSDVLSTYDLMTMVVEGANLLQSTGLTSRRVVTFMEVDPFSYALDLKPSLHGYPMFWANQRFTRDNHTTPENLFKDITFVMVPLVPYWPEQWLLMQEIYGPYLREHFEPTARSTHWVLWRRR